MNLCILMFLYIFFWLAGLLPTAGVWFYFTYLLEIYLLKKNIDLFNTYFPHFRLNKWADSPTWKKSIKI